MILISEIIWLVIYILTIYLGVIFSDILLFSISFIILGFSGVEFSMGIIISILYKNFNESLNLDDNNKFNKQNYYVKNIKNNI